MRHPDARLLSGKNTAKVLRLCSTLKTPDTPIQILSGILRYSTLDFSHLLHRRSHSMSFTSTTVILAPTPMSALAELIRLTIYTWVPSGH